MKAVDESDEIKVTFVSLMLNLTENLEVHFDARSSTSSSTASDIALTVSWIVVLSTSERANREQLQTII